MNRKHQKISGDLHLLIGMWLEEHPVRQIYFAPLDVIFSMFNVVEPDLLYMSNERAAQVLTEANVKGASELVIEIGSQGTRGRDETIKRRLYEPRADAGGRAPTRVSSIAPTLDHCIAPTRVRTIAPTMTAAT